MLSSWASVMTSAASWFACPCGVCVCGLVPNADGSVNVGVSSAHVALVGRRCVGALH